MAQDELRHLRIVLGVEAPPELSDDDIEEALMGEVIDIGDYNIDVLRVWAVEEIESALTHEERR